MFFNASRRDNASRLTLVGALLVSGLSLSACQTTSASGSGDIELSPNVARGFLNEYWAKPYPLAFAVTTGGQMYSWYVCNGPRCTNPTNDVNKTLQDCQERSGLPCKLFAKGKSIVWTKANGELYTLDDVYAVLGMTKEDRIKETYQNLSNMKLCENALSEDGTSWTDVYGERYSVEEAKSRNMQPAFCAKLLGRGG